MTFDGKRALVTARLGIGAAVARRLATGGATVVLADASRRRFGGAWGPGDRAGRARRGAGRAGDGDVDVLVNVAASARTTTAPETTLETWEDVFAVNARGTFLCCKHAIPGMAARGGGSIVNVASVAALVGLPRRAAYCAFEGRGRPRSPARSRSTT